MGVRRARTRAPRAPAAPGGARLALMRARLLVIAAGHLAVGQEKFACSEVSPGVACFVDNPDRCMSSARCARLTSRLRGRSTIADPYASLAAVARRERAAIAEQTRRAASSDEIAVAACRVEGCLPSYATCPEQDVGEHARAEISSLAEFGFDPTRADARRRRRPLEHWSSFVSARSDRRGDELFEPRGDAPVIERRGDEPVIAFLHLQKTGGWSLVRLAEDAGLACPDEARACKPPADVADAIAAGGADDVATALSALGAGGFRFVHVERSLRALAPAPTHTWITVVREPMARLLSDYRMTVGALRAPLPRGRARADARLWPDDVECVAPFRARENATVGALAAAPLLGASYCCLLYTSPSPRD